MDTAKIENVTTTDESMYIPTETVENAAGTANEQQEQVEDNDRTEDEQPDHRDTPAATTEDNRSGQPLSDLDVAAQYADQEMQSMMQQLESTTVKAPFNPPQIEEADEDESSESEDESKDEEEQIGEDQAALREEIEEGMAKDSSKTTSPLRTPNEVSSVPVQEPDVDQLTAETSIAPCGEILNISRIGLNATIKTTSAMSKPLDEGSILCFEDRSVLGCVDELFGPIAMPLYLVRFADASKIPAQATNGMPVFYATDKAQYVVPEHLHSKGTDASNIYDEETEEVEYSDDEQERAAKRSSRKRSRQPRQEQTEFIGPATNPHPQASRSQKSPPRRGVYSAEPSKQRTAVGGPTKYTQPSWNAPARGQQAYHASPMQQRSGERGRGYPPRHQDQPPQQYPQPMYQQAHMPMHPPMPPHSQYAPPMYAPPQQPYQQPGNPYQPPMQYYQAPPQQPPRGMPPRQQYPGGGYAPSPQPPGAYPPSQQYQYQPPRQPPRQQYPRGW